MVHSSYKVDGKGKNQETDENHKGVMKGIWYVFEEGILIYINWK